MYVGGNMRIITIVVKEINNGEDATIEVQHSHDGKQSEVEFVTVQMLNEFLFVKVGKVAKSKAQFKPNNSQIQHNEVLN
jgi:hypothetical protein